MPSKPLIKPKESWYNNNEDELPWEDKIREMNIFAKLSSNRTKKENKTL